jgi:hypothetical protein
MKNKSIQFSVCMVLVATIGIVMLSSGIYVQKTPTVKTNPVKNITATSAQSGYVITSTGVTITKHGICLSKGSGPTIKNTVYGAEKAPGPNFTVQLTGLAPGMKLYIRSFITTSTETIYGNEISFTTAAKK